MSSSAHWFEAERSLLALRQPQEKPSQEDTKLFLERPRWIDDEQARTRQSALRDNFANPQFRLPYFRNAERFDVGNDPLVQSIASDGIPQNENASREPLQSAQQHLDRGGT